MNAKTLAVRTLSGAIYIAIIICCIFLGEQAVYTLASVMALLSVWEFGKIMHSAKDMNVWRKTGLALDAVAVVTLAWLPLGFTFMIFIIAVLARFTIEIYSRSDNPIRNVAISMMTYLYIGMPLACMSLLEFYSSSWVTGPSMLLLAIFLMIWINDTGAFLVGSTFGRHRLFERVSPKKSWEGFFGGLGFNIVAAILFSLFCSEWFGADFGMGWWVGLGMIVTVFATWGDLFESLYKRSLHLKDSGNMIPGHGGILDRIDSLLFVMPTVLVYYTIWQFCK